MIKEDMIVKEHKRELNKILKKNSIYSLNSRKNKKEEDITEFLLNNNTIKEIMDSYSKEEILEDNEFKEDILDFLVKRLKDYGGKE